MKKLDKKLPQMLKAIDELYYEEKDKDKKEQLGIYHKNLSEKLDEVSRAKFDKNDKFYRGVIQKFKQTEESIEKFKVKQLKITELFSYLANLAEQLDALLFRWNRAEKS